MDKMIDALLTISGGHYNQPVSQMAVDMMIPSVMYLPNHDQWNGSFKDYLEKMGVDYYTAMNDIMSVGRLNGDTTCGDCYYALAMVYADYGLAIHGDKELALKLAYGWLTDPDR